MVCGITVADTMNNDEVTRSKDSLTKKKQFGSLNKHKKLKKASFFQPINTLTRPIISATVPEKAKIREEISFPKTYERDDGYGDALYKSNNMNEQIGDNITDNPTNHDGDNNHDPILVSSSPHKSLKTPIKLNTLQNSDDSFDGIRWGQPLNQPLSSPLRDYMIRNPGKLPENENVASNNNPDHSIFINEQTNSVLNKYGSNELHNNLIHTPSLLRTQSESLPLIKSNNNGKNVPSLLRTKSIAADFFKVSSNLSNNTLNDWIDKFSNKTDDHPKSMDDVLDDDDTFERVNVQQLHNNKEYIIDRDHDNTNNNTNSNIEKNNDQPEDLIISQLTDSLNNLESPVKKKSSNERHTIVQTLLQEEINDESPINSKPILNNMESDDMDPFSDDDDLILKALDRVATSQRLSISNNNMVGNDSDCESDDPFTDDDSALMNVLESTSKPRDNIDIPTTSPEIPISKSFSGVNKYNIRQEFSSGTFNQQKGSSEIENNSILSFSRPNLNRYHIKSILSRNYGPSLSKKQMILDVTDCESINRKLIVRGEYTDLDYQVNDIVHVIVTNPTNPRLIDDSNNLLIWNPDILLSATTISNQIICSRKTVMTNRYKFPGTSSIPLIVGEIVHRIFQECFYQEIWSSEFMNNLVETYILEYIQSIFSIDETIDKVRDEIEKHLPYLNTWFEKYYRKPLSTLNYIPTNKHNESIMFSANKALDIEENIWSPMFGLNGMVDVTLETRLENKATMGQYLLPLEIKTGREYITHSAQATLYSLLFKDRYDMDIESFLLVYTKDQLTRKCDISQNDLKALVNLRNKVTKYFKENTRELPPLLQSSTCERCEIQESCMTINKLLEHGTSESSGLSEEVYDDLTIHLNNNPEYTQFYNHWDDLITKEEGIMKQANKYLWTLTARQRETTDGKAIGNLIITESDDDEDSKRFIYKLKRNSDSGPSLLGSQLASGDRIVVSDEVGHFGIAHGIVKELTYSMISISTSRRIISSDMKLTNFNRKNNQVFQGVLHKTQQENPETDKTFRIDKNEMYSGMALARYNVLNLFLASGDVLRRNLVVDLKTPRFSSANYELPSKVVRDLNDNQVDAIQKVLTAEDYALILGMPGTGKTTVIAQIIKILTQRGKSVLLTSYTHSAVDNILLKIKDFGIGILRVGNPSVVHKDIKKFIPGYNEDNKFDTHQKFLDAYLTPQVVASSCLGINDIAFSLRTKFDYCIIDEASQVSMPVSLGPLRFCEKFVLVGDHNQLPPLVQHPDLRVKHELSQSLFMKLARKHPQSVATLTHQYRMCSDVMDLSNILIYENELQCGTKAVAEQRLIIPQKDRINEFVSESIPESKRWMDIILQEENKVIFFDHDNVPALESCNGEIIENPIEASLVTQIVNALIQTGVDEDSIGVMSFNRGQLRLLKRTLSGRNVEILTADQFQGRDKDCIIISLVRSNEENKAGDLVKEWRRINVAITRAKCKLIILGSKSTLSNAETTRKFLELLSSKNWIYQLPSKADTFYNFGDEYPKHSPSMKRHKGTPKLLKKNIILKDIINEMITG